MNNSKVSRTPEKIRRVQELRRSNATVPIPARKKPEPQISDFYDEEEEDIPFFWVDRDDLEG